MPDLMNIREVATYLGVSERHAWRLREEGQLPAIKIKGRVLFHPDDVRAYVESARQSPADHAAERAASKIREIVSLAPVMTSAQRRELAALLVREADLVRA